MARPAENAASGLRVYPGTEPGAQATSRSSAGDDFGGGGKSLYSVRSPWRTWSSVRFQPPRPAGAPDATLQRGAFN